MTRRSLDGWKNGKQRPAASDVKITRADGTVEYQSALPAVAPRNYVGGTHRIKARGRIAVDRSKRERD
jgi:hypothetical protein